MKNWSEVNERTGGNPNVAMYLGIYFAFGVGSAALVVLNTLILWIFCSIEVRTRHPPIIAVICSSSCMAQPVSK